MQKTSTTTPQAARYDLLLNLADQACLETWLRQLQATPSLASQA